VGKRMIPFFQGAAGGAPAVGTVFASTLYTGNGANRTITSGIDADLVWIKDRSGSTDHALYDTVRGATLDLVSNAPSAETTQSTGLTAFGATGFNIGTLAKINTNLATYAAWSFGEAPRFFDVVTYTGNNTAGRAISHNLGTVPGLIIVRVRSTTGNWRVYHRASGSGVGLILESTGVNNSIVLKDFGTGDNNNGGAHIPPTASEFYVGTGTAMNNSSFTYVAYLFAHDTASDGIVQCGSYTGNGSASGPTVTLGWNPQWVLIKNTTSGATNWVIFDTARGIVAGNDPTLCPNTSNSENAVLPMADHIDLTGTGFQLASDNANINGSGGTYVFLAIREA
jgi:hypothetical protein